MDQQTVTLIHKEPSQTQQHELLNFTQSVVELESEIFQKARNPNQRVRNDESPITPNLPMGNDGFVCEADHANLVSNKFTDKHSTPATSYCHDEFVKTQINDFSIDREKHKNLPSANRQTMEFQSETEPRASPRPIHLSSPRLQTDDVTADKSNALNVIHLSRVYFSQQTVSDGQSNQTFQEAPRTEYQMVEKELKSINKNMDKSPKKHRMAYATHVIPQKKPGTVRTQNASSISSTDKTNFKGLFQSSSASPSKKSSKKNNSTSELDKYVYFLPAPRNTPSCTEIRERVPIEKNGENSDSRLEGISVGAGSSKNIEYVPEQVQVVADKEGRVLVVNLAGKKISGAETKSTTTQNPSPKKWSPVIMKESEMGSGLNNERHKFSESSVRHPLDQTKHVIKRNRDGTFGIVNSPLDISPSKNLIVTLPVSIAVDNTRNDINNNNTCSLHGLPHGRRDLVQSHNQNNLIERMYIDAPIAMRDAVIRNNQCFVSQTHGVQNHKLPQYCSAKTTELRSYVHKHNHENSNHSPYKTYSGRPTNVCYPENNGPAIVYIEDNSNGTFHDSRTNLEGNSNNGTFDRAHLEGKSSGTFDHTHLGGNSNRTFDHSSASLNGNSIEPYQLDQPCGVASGNDFNRHKKASIPKTNLNKPNYSVQTAARDQHEPRQYVPPQKQVKKAAGKIYNDFTNITATSKNKTVPVSSISQTNRSSSEVQRNAPNSEADNRYKCDWPACTKGFRHYSFLVLHKRIHTGERPYNCSWNGCTREFRRSDDYQRHYRVHTGVKPYTCLVCGKAFKRSDHRLFHYRSIHQMEEVSGKIMNKLK